MKRFLNKVVIVTGASSGIGEVIAIAFAKEGAKLCLVGRNVERLEKVKEVCEIAGSNEVQALQIDLTKMDQLSTIVDKTIDTFERIDVLVNNAAGVTIQPFNEISLENYEAQMNTNFRAPFFLSQQALPYLEISQGNIVNISSYISLTAVYPAGIVMVYSISKAALDHFGRCLSSVCASKEIRVNNINPANVDTPMNRYGVKEGVIEGGGNKQPLGMIPAENIATTVLFVASDDAQYMTGVTLPVDAGILHSTPSVTSK